jgi:protein-tyrosine phosphatase
VEYSSYSSPNGTLPLTFASKTFEVMGGPYPMKPAFCKGVKLAQEIDLPCDIDLATADFGVPDYGDCRVAVLQTIPLILGGQAVYVGCMGGIGRTGTFLAILAKLANACSLNDKKFDAIQYVRSAYLKHAVERETQVQFIKDFKVDDIAKFVKAYTRLDKR